MLWLWKWWWCSCSCCRLSNPTKQSWQSSSMHRKCSRLYCTAQDEAPTMIQTHACLGKAGISMHNMKLKTFIVMCISTSCTQRKFSCQHAQHRSCSSVDNDCTVGKIVTKQKQQPHAAWLQISALNVVNANALVRPCNNVSNDGTISQAY